KKTRPRLPAQRDGLATDSRRRGAASSAKASTSRTPTKQPRRIIHSCSRKLMRSSCLGWWVVRLPARRGRIDLVSLGRWMVGGRVGDQGRRGQSQTQHHGGQERRARRGR